MAVTLTDLLPSLSIRHTFPSKSFSSSKPSRILITTRRRRAIHCSIAKESSSSPSSTIHQSGDGDGDGSILDCVVVGAGISGLCIAQALATKHSEIARNVIVTEARDRVGGNIITVEKDGFLWEEGPNSFQPSDPMLTTVCCHNLLDAVIPDCGSVDVCAGGYYYLKSIFNQTKTVSWNLYEGVDCGLKDDLVFGDPTAPRFVLWNGKLRPVPSGPMDLPFFDLMSFTGKLRAGFGAFGLRPPPPGHEESVEEFVRRNLGSEVFERLIEPFCSGVYAGDPAKLSMKAAFGKVWNLEQNGGSIIGGAFKAFQDRKKNPKPPRDPRLPTPKGQTVCSFKKGLSMLPEALSKRLEGKVKLFWKLLSIEKLDRGYSLRYDTPEGLISVQTKSIILTVPSHVASSLLRPLSAVAANALSKFYYPPVAAVSISYPKEAIRRECLIDGELKGFGQLHPRSQGVETLGTIYSSSLFPNRAPPGRVLLLNYIGGATNPGILSKTDGELVEAVDRDLRKMLINSNAKGPLALAVRVWPQAIPQFLVGHLDLLEAAKGAVRDSSLNGLFLGGNYVTGVALGRCVEGANESAAELSKFLLEYSLK